MRKQEFVDGLKVALNGMITPSLVKENIVYYEDYINTEIRKGRSEEEVLASLGDPRLIARTIIETNGQGDTISSNNFREVRESEDQYGEKAFHKKVFHIPSWLWFIIVTFIILFVVSAIFSVVSFLLPIVFPILLIIFFVKLFRDWLD